MGGKTSMLTHEICGLVEEILFNENQNKDVEPIGYIDLKKRVEIPNSLGNVVKSVDSNGYFTMYSDESGQESDWLPMGILKDAVLELILFAVENYYEDVYANNLKTFTFEYTEVCYGTITIDALNEEQARDLIACGEGERLIIKNKEEIGEVVNMK